MLFPLLAAAVAAVACLTVGVVAGFLVRVMRPSQAVPLLTAASLAVSLASGLALTAIATGMVAGLTSVAAEGDWSAAIVEAELPIPRWLGAVALLAVLLLLLRAALRTTAIVAALVRADRMCRNIRGDGGPVVIVDDDSADAYTVAGIRGCVVISQRLFSRLDTDERRVLTAHELSHLTRRHHLYVHVTDIAAAANPLLRSVSAAVRLGVERWADEDAALGIGDRRTAGRALARVALLRSALARTQLPVAPRSGARFASTLGVGALQVFSRVQALLEPAPRQRTGRLAIAALLSVAVLLVGIASLADIHETIENAAAYPYR